MHSWTRASPAALAGARSRAATEAMAGEGAARRHSVSGLAYREIWHASDVNILRGELDRKIGGV